MKTTRSIPGLKTSAFTLIELLTVIAIIGILAAIMIPTVSAVRGKAKAVEALSQMRQLGVGVMAYCSDNRGNILPGPLNTGQDFDYNGPAFVPGGGGNSRQGRLLTYIHPYLNLVAPASPQGFLQAKQFMTSAQRAYDQSLPAGTGPRYFTAMVSGTRPLGYADSTPPSLPKPLSSVETPSSSEMLREADKEAKWVSTTSDAYNRCPPKPLHGNRRHIAYFDGHVRSFSLAESDRATTP
ncbi:prepilin-type N-terminal cleavage/methylation domain-containing protein [Geminisphaera colitermitum]|uniref:prepilin-type N-terminal cleavage/methylation domain-containing protein n=1 Tax=Geminisphaera colitermitum TaxID=1148786 RepID=UPI000158D5C7|nr:prepilin-type N-terminal cleavage/methylation domain-containing protein [Geminisphaera colitermitum]